MSDGIGNDFHLNFKFLNQVESKTSQSENVFKPFTRFGTQFRVNYCYLLRKLRKFGDKSGNSLATNKKKKKGKKKNFKF